jgi:hypothetical protein
MEISSSSYKYSQKHGEITKIVVNHLKKEGYNVKAKNSGSSLDSPQKLQGFIPDIYAEKNFNKIIAEIETCENLLGKDLIKWKRFSNNGNTFWVIVPEYCLNEAITKKEAFNLPYEIYYITSLGELKSLN